MASSAMLFVRAVSVTPSTTRASCQFSRLCTAVLSTGRRSCGSRSPPRESGRVVLPQLDAAHPLRALPEVVAGDEQPRRPAVLWVERLVLVLVRDPRLPIADVLER